MQQGAGGAFYLVTSSSSSAPRRPSARPPVRPRGKQKGRVRANEQVKICCPTSFDQENQRREESELWIETVLSKIQREKKGGRVTPTEPTESRCDDATCGPSLIREEPPSSLHNSIPLQHRLARHLAPLTASPDSGDPHPMASKKKWAEQRELRRERQFSTRDDASVASGTSGPGRSTTRGRFSESWKRLSSRGGSTKRGALNSQQPPVRCPLASTCAGD